MAHVIRKEYCFGCGACAFACPFDVPVYDLESNTYSIPKEKCVDCGQCRDICPGAAIIPGTDAKKILSIHIDEEACIGCSLCSRNCPAGAITGEVKHPFTIHEDKCIKCGFCLTKCRKDAIRATFSTVFAPPVI
jgi:electron transport complex protein RnfB